MKYTIYLGFLVLLTFCAACGSTRSYTPSNVSSAKTSPVANTSPVKLSTGEIESAEEGLDLQAVTALAKKAKNAEDLERLLNQPDSINNLDLDEDGKVDYISVTEYKDSTKTTKGFSLSVDLGGGNIQEVATIMLERDGAKDPTVDVAVNGNEEIYGTDDSYGGSWDYADSSFSSYAYGNHSYYSSPYHYGYYPSYYSPFAVTATSGYRTRMQPYRGNSSLTSRASAWLKTKLTSPNAGKSASNIKAPLSKPSVAQQTFQKTNPSRTVRTSSPSYSSSTTRSTSSSSSSSISRPSTSSSSSSSSSSSRSSSSSGRKR